MLNLHADSGGGGDISIRYTYFQFTYKVSNEITWKYVYKYYSQTHVPNFRCIIIFGLEVINHFRCIIIIGLEVIDHFRCIIIIWIGSYQPFSCIIIIWIGSYQPFSLYNYNLDWKLSTIFLYNWIGLEVIDHFRCIIIIWIGSYQPFSLYNYNLDWKLSTIFVV